jgi:phosphate transport system protein
VTRTPADAPSEILSAPALPPDYAADMQALRDRLLKMSNRCREQLHLALEAFEAGSNDKVPWIEDLDQSVDRDEVSIDALVLRILAVRHPVAADLRMVTGAFRIVTDLERIGDETLQIARQAAIAQPEAEVQRRRLHAMGNTTEALLADACRSFFEGDERVAGQARRAAETIDALYEETLHDVAAMLSQESVAPRTVMNVVEVARCLRRIAAHASNVARGTLFVLGRGDMPL